jgi:hypothetical protein
MKKKIFLVIPLSILMTMLIQDAGMTKRIFDTELQFNPKAGMTYHYAQMTNLSGSEISFQRQERFGGTIQTIFDDTVNSNTNGLISWSLAFQTYDVLNEIDVVADEMPGGGPWGPSRGPYRDMPLPMNPDKDGTPPDKSQPSPDSEKEKANPPQSPEPMQGGGGGSGGGGGGGGLGPSGGGGGGSSGGQWGQQQRREESADFRITPILETQLNYTLAQDGRLMDMQGLDLIGDFYDPQNQISVRQVFQSSHFLTLPNYQVHLGESWRGPFFWTIPFVGEARKIDMQYTLEEISIQERYRLANIAFYGVTQFDTVTTDEKWDDEFGCDVRVDSDLHADIMLRGNILFDIDRGIVVSIGDDIRSKQFVYYINWNSFPRPWGGNYFLSTIVVDRMDTRTPLGNVLDTEPRKDHIIQDMVWRTWLIVE